MPLSDGYTPCRTRSGSPEMVPFNGPPLLPTLSRQPASCRCFAISLALGIRIDELRDQPDYVQRIFREAD